MNVASVTRLVAAIVLSATGCATVAPRSAADRVAASPAASPAASATSTSPGAPRSCGTDRPAVALEFRSSFWLNLHDFLVTESKRRRGVHDEAAAAFRPVAADTTGARPLTPTERAQWDRIVAAYDRAARATPMADSALVAMNTRLATIAESGEPADVTVASPLVPALGDALRAAAPIYRAVWWPTHDRQNRAWIAAMRRQLDVGTCLFARESELLGGSFPSATVPVEASVYASWFGAYTTLEPLQITISSAAVGAQEDGGLEVLLHEAGHLVLGPLDSALAATAARQHRRLPEELSHLVLFYTAGELVRSVAPAHVPHAEAYGIWRQNETAGRYRAILVRAWQPYLEGRVDFATAVDHLVRMLDPM